jgi:hypothetical protein
VRRIRHQCQERTPTLPAAERWGSFVTPTSENLISTCSLMAVAV